MDLLRALRVGSASTPELLGVRNFCVLFSEPCDLPTIHLLFPFTGEETEAHDIRRIGADAGFSFYFPFSRSHTFKSRELHLPIMGQACPIRRDLRAHPSRTLFHLTDISIEPGNTQKQTGSDLDNSLNLCTKWWALFPRAGECAVIA